MALYDETSPTLQYFQKPIFGKKTLLRNPDGSRTGASTALTAGLSWMSGLSPLGSEAGRSLDNLIQGGRRPDYLMDQEFYANNVAEAERKAATIQTAVGGAADTVRGIMEQVAGALTGTGAAASMATGATSKPSAITPKPDNGLTPEKLVSKVISPTDPKLSFSELLKKGSRNVMTPEQRQRSILKSRSLMNTLPSQDTFLEDPNLVPDTPDMRQKINYYQNSGLKMFKKGGKVTAPPWFMKFKAKKKVSGKKRLISHHGNRGS